MRRRSTHFMSVAFAATVLLALFVLLAGATVGAQSDPDADGPTADIIVVMIDDHAYIPDERVLERLPNIRELFLENGLRFNQMHNETPLCCPARAGLLSGQHTLTHHVVANNGNPLNQKRTLPVALHKAGYHTVLVGKYLNRWHRTVTPPGWDDVAIAKGSYRPAFWRNGKLKNFQDMFIDQANSVQARNWTRSAPLDQPMFLLTSVRGPHVDQCEHDKKQVCYEPRVMERDEGGPECADIPDFKPPSYRTASRSGARQPMPDWPDGWKLVDVCESLLVVDRMVGDLVTAQAARERPAYFVLLSDNGMAWGQHGDPFKRVPWSTQMPFYINGPGVEPGDSEALLSIIDVPLTFAEIAGAKMPWADGRSFLDVLQGDGTGLDEMLHVQDGSWHGVRTLDRYYVRWDDGTQELYAYREDPWLLDNLAADEPDELIRLDERLDAWLVSSTQPKPASRSSRGD